MAVATKAKEYIKLRAKNLLLKSKLYWLVEPFSGLLMRLVYMSKFVKWCDLRSDPEFNYHYEAPLFKHRNELYEFLLKTHHLDGEIDYLEFGVGAGHSLRWWLEHNRNPSSRFVGFDTFTGLPGDWGSVKKGAFSTEGRVPDVEDSRVSFEVGLFQDTLERFLSEFSFAGKKVIHLDADLYSSTLFALARLAPKLRKGDILIFDDFATIDGFTYEFRALCDFISAYKLGYRLLGAARYYAQVAIELV